MSKSKRKQQQATTNATRDVPRTSIGTTSSTPINDNARMEPDIANEGVVWILLIILHNSNNSRRCAGTTDINDSVVGRFQSEAMVQEVLLCFPDQSTPSALHGKALASVPLIHGEVNSRFVVSNPMHVLLME